MRLCGVYSYHFVLDGAKVLQKKRIYKSFDKKQSFRMHKLRIRYCFCREKAVPLSPEKDMRPKQICLLSALRAAPARVKQRW